MDKVLVSDIEKYLDGNYDWDNNPDNIEYDFEYEKPEYLKHFNQSRMNNDYVAVWDYEGYLDAKYEPGCIFIYKDFSKVLLEYNLYFMFKSLNNYDLIGLSNNIVNNIISDKFIVNIFCEDELIFRKKISLKNRHISNENNWWYIDNSASFYYRNSFPDIDYIVDDIEYYSYKEVELVIQDLK